MTDARRAQALAFLVAGAFFMENLDGTAITTALRPMARSFGTDAVALNVGITAYLLALAVFVPMSGWIADRFGARTTFATAIAVFTLSSVLCGFAGGVAEFTLARVAQGMGGAMMVPVGRLVVLRNTAKSDLVRAISTIVWPGLVAPVLGPPVGGWIADHAGWRWIFFLNVPLGFVALAVALRLVPNSREEVRPPFDWAGFALVGLGCLLLTSSVDRLSGRPIPWGEAVLLFLGAAVLTLLAVRHLRRAAHPLLRLEALRILTFSTTLAGGSLARCAIGAMPFLLALYFQLGMGKSAAAAGALVLWVFAGNLAMKTVTTFVLRRFGFRRTLLVNGGLAVLSILAAPFLTATTPLGVVAAVLFLGGMFRSMQFTALNTLGFADVPPERMSGASTLSSTVGGLTFGIGIGFAAASLRLAGLFHGTVGADPSLADFRLAFLFTAFLALASLVDVLRLPADAGREVSGHRG